jgi:hypothetical protein
VHADIETVTISEYYQVSDSVHFFSESQITQSPSVTVSQVLTERKLSVA